MTTPGKQLPSERLAPRHQHKLFDILAELGGAELLPVPAQELASRLNIIPNTVSRAAAFLVQGGLLQGGRGTWALTETGYAFAQLRATDSARARLLLRDHWQDSWFHRRAAERLASGPADEADLAAHLRAGLSTTRERGVFLVEWMVYALLVNRDQQGLVSLPGGQQAGPRTAASAPPRPKPQEAPLGVLSPFLKTSPEEFDALPQAEFLALMQAYRTVFVQLSPNLSQPPGN